MRARESQCPRIWECNEELRGPAVSFTRVKNGAVAGGLTGDTACCYCYCCCLTFHADSILCLNVLCFLLRGVLSTPYYLIAIFLDEPNSELD